MTDARLLPAELPLFPLQGCILLPGELLPLNIFEPRYLNMIDDARAGHGHIGIVQPAAPAPTGEPVLLQTGTAGSIKSFVETPDGRYLITLSGVSRFSLRGETAGAAPYRIGHADYQPYAADLAARVPLSGDRDRLVQLVRSWFAGLGLQTDWGLMADMPLEQLVDKLAMMAPFTPAARQGLLEAADPAARLSQLEALIATQIAGSAGGTLQ
tara:strand:- start:18532 stop:19167 length:636 start_codon:yes stop_codon:yes gene_type:complete